MQFKLPFKQPPFIRILRINKYEVNLNNFLKILGDTSICELLILYGKQTVPVVCKFDI